MSTLTTILLAIVGLVGGFLGWKAKGGLAAREVGKAKEALAESERVARAEKARRKVVQQRAEIMEHKAKALENILKEKEDLAGKEQEIDESNSSETNHRLDHMFDGFTESDRVPDLSGSGSGNGDGKD